jgi:hypothetical protein
VKTELHALYLTLLGMKHSFSTQASMVPESLSVGGESHEQMADNKQRRLSLMEKRLFVADLESSLPWYRESYLRTPPGIRSDELSYFIEVQECLLSRLREEIKKEAGS